jgi:hypothetical protein
MLRLIMGSLLLFVMATAGSVAGMFIYELAKPEIWSLGTHLLNKAPF